MKFSVFISVLLSLCVSLQLVECGSSTITFARPIVKGPESNNTVILPDRYFAQKLDHFVNKTPEWQQVVFLKTWFIFYFNTKKRYLVNDKYFTGNGPVFLYIEGENPLDQYWLLEKSIVDYYGKRYVSEWQIFGIKSSFNLT
jgi:hypothetical protein